jgi:hypothetical protein
MPDPYARHAIVWFMQLLEAAGSCACRSGWMPAALGSFAQPCRSRLFGGEQSFHSLGRTAVYEVGLLSEGPERLNSLPHAH